MTHQRIVISKPVSDNQCRIWPEFAAKKVSDIWNNPDAFAVLDSPRAGGSYKISGQATWWTSGNNDEESQRVRARLTTWLIDERSKTDEIPWVTYERIRELTAKEPLSMTRRADRLLRKLTSYPSSNIDFTQTEDIVPELLAWSESVDAGELNHLLSMLRRDGLVHSNGQSISVTDAGHQRIQDSDDEPRARIGF